MKETLQPDIRCWIVTEGLAGTENQCIGVALSLGIPFEVKRISLGFPWTILSPYVPFERFLGSYKGLSAPWPDLVIASGRKSIAASRFIKRASGGKTVTVQIQDPRVPANDFDLVAVPSHDPMRGDNVIVTDATPNKISDDVLKMAKERFPHFGEMPSPRVAVLIGGKSKAYDFTEEDTHKIIKQLQLIDASLMITCSRRSGEENEKNLRNALRGDNIYFWEGGDDNPYLGYLAWADAILVTADSASMISESCTTGKPVYMIPLSGGAARLDALHKHLIDRGCLRVFDGSIEPYTYEPLRDAKVVADAIKNRFGALLGLTDD